METIKFENMDGLRYLSTLSNDSVDLVLTDPPYIISKSSGMDKHYRRVNEEPATLMKTEAEWQEYVSRSTVEDTPKCKANYMTYGSVYGKKYCVRTDYGRWDSDFTMDTLDRFIHAYYDKLKKGGTLIIFFDLWKLTPLKQLLEKNRFKQIRFIEWVKTNPQPLNSGVNYLTNCREMALVGIKGSKPTFNSRYDNGLYLFPIQGGRDRFHPTQKSVRLFERLVEKHTNEGDVVLDTFMGGGTTAMACLNTSRQFRGCELNERYFEQATRALQNRAMLREDLKKKVRDDYN